MPGCGVRLRKGENVDSLQRRWPRLARAQFRRLSVVFLGFVLAAGLALGARSAVSDEEQATAEPFSHLDVKAFGLAGTFKPASLDGDRTVGVIVKLKGESVGKQNADALKQGNGLSKAEKAAIREQLKGQQGPVADRIAGLGGSVYAQYQDAYNGMAVRIPLKNLEALQALPEVVAVQPDGW